MLFFWCLVYFSFVQGTFSANILIVDEVPSPSHQIWNYAIAEGLLAKGHNVTILGPIGVRSIKHKNFHFLSLGDTHKEVMEAFNPEDMTTGSLYFMVKSFYDYIINSCRCSLKAEGFQTLMAYPKDYKFDAILIDTTLSNCLLPLIQKFNYPPSVAITAFLLPPDLSMVFGNDVQPSYLSNYYSDYSDTMNFWQRLNNYLIVHTDLFFRKVYVNRYTNNIAREVFGTNMDSMSNLENHVSLLLCNWNPVLHPPQPVTPNIIPVAGLHIKPKPLPQDLQKIMDDASHGVILFSLGTNVQPSGMTLEKKNAIINTFSKLKQIVLWKFETNDTTLPKNVVIRKWLPQTDILAHPNLKLFISHGGGLSTIEASHFGVPILGMPFFGDQHSNIANLVNKDVARKLDYASLTSQTFLDNLNELLYNKKYLENMKTLSERMRDQPESPLERAVFWIEYAIRHNGTHFLSPKSRSLPSFVTSCTDIHLFLLSVVILIIYSVRSLFTCLNKFRKPKTKPNYSLKKTKKTN